MRRSRINDEESLPVKVNVPLAAEEDSGDCTILQACAWSDGGAEFVFMDGTALIFRDEMRTFVALSPPTSHQGIVGVVAPKNVFYTPLALSAYHAKLKEALMLYNRFTAHPHLIPSFFEGGAFTAEGKPCAHQRRTEERPKPPFFTHRACTTCVASPPPLSPLSLSPSLPIPTSSFFPTKDPSCFPTSPFHYWLARDERLLERSTVFARCHRDVLEVPPRPHANDFTGPTWSERAPSCASSVSLQDPSPLTRTPQERLRRRSRGNGTAYRTPSPTPVHPLQDNGNDQKRSSTVAATEARTSAASGSSTLSSSPTPSSSTAGSAPSSEVHFPVGEEMTLWCVHHRVSLTLHWHQQLFTVRWPLQIGSDAEGEAEEGDGKERRAFAMEQVFPVASPPPEWVPMLSLLWCMGMPEKKKETDVAPPPSPTHPFASGSSLRSTLSSVNDAVHFTEREDWCSLPFPSAIVCTPTRTSSLHRSSLRFPSADPSHRLPLVTATDIALAPCQDVLRVATSLRHPSSAPSSRPRLLWQWCRERAAHGPSLDRLVTMYWYIPHPTFFPSVTTPIGADPPRTAKGGKAPPNDAKEEEEEVLLLRIDPAGAHPPLRLCRLGTVPPEEEEAVPQDAFPDASGFSFASHRHPSLERSEAASFPSLPPHGRQKDRMQRGACGMHGAMAGLERAPTVSMGARPPRGVPAAWCTLHVRRFRGVAKWFMIPEREVGEAQRVEEGKTHPTERHMLDVVPAWAMAAVGTPLSFVVSPPSPPPATASLFSSVGTIHFSEAEVLELRCVPSSCLHEYAAQHHGDDHEDAQHTPPQKKKSGAPPFYILSSLQGYASFAASTAFAPFMPCDDTHSTLAPQEARRRGRASRPAVHRHQVGRLAAATLAEVLVRHGKRLLRVGVPQWRTRETMARGGQWGGGVSRALVPSASLVGSAVSSTDTEAVALAAVRVDGVGNFTAWGNEVVRGHFDDGTVLCLVPGPQHRMRRVYDPTHPNPWVALEEEEEEAEEVWSDDGRGGGWRSAVHAGGRRRVSCSDGTGVASLSPTSHPHSHAIPPQNRRHGSRIPRPSAWSSYSTSLPSSAASCASFFFLEGEESLVVRGRLGSGGAAGTSVVVRLVQLPYLGLLQSHRHNVEAEEKWGVDFCSSHGSCSSFYASLLPYVDVLIQFRRRIVADLVLTYQEEEEEKRHKW